MANEKIWAFLAHLGYNMWADPEEKDGVRAFPQPSDTNFASPTLRFEREVWEKVTDRLAAAGGNMIVLDVGEGIRFDCYPEIAAEDAWSKDEVRTELARLRGMGFEVIPKLNFSTCHDEWMGLYSRCVSTPLYYKFVEEIIAETAELFGHPRFFHIGMDEEGLNCQKLYNYVVIRQGELWWHDFNHIVGCVEKAGCRPWMWADYVWAHQDEFIKKMSRDILMSNWYYGEIRNLPEQFAVYVDAYDVLDKNGFDQIPGGSNWWIKDNFVQTAEYGSSHLSGEHTLGYLQTIWHPMTGGFEEQQMHGIDQLALARKSISR